MRWRRGASSDVSLCDKWAGCGAVRGQPGAAAMGECVVAIKARVDGSGVGTTRESWKGGGGGTKIVC